MMAPSPQAALEIHLVRHWSTSTMMRANLRAGGLSDEGEYSRGTYVAMFDGATILGVAAHYRDDSLMLQAQRGLAQVARGAVGESKAPVERIIGAWTQVNGAAATTGAMTVGGNATVSGAVNANGDVDLHRKEGASLVPKADLSNAYVMARYRFTRSFSAGVGV